MLSQSDSRSTLDYSSKSEHYGPMSSDVAVSPSTSLLGLRDTGHSSSRLSVPRSLSNSDNRASRLSYQSYISRASTVVDGWGWNDPEPDDHLHNPDPKRDRKRGSVFTVRGVLNIGCLFLLLICLIGLFAGYPIAMALTERKQGNNGGYNVGGINATGQVPFIPNFTQLVDVDTPEDGMVWLSPEGQEYQLVFSDEFNKDGRTFYPGDDPYWQAVDLHYWPTGDLEWYDPSTITTEGGNLKISMTKEPINGLDYKSGMLQSWNQMCFQYSFYIEVRVSLPGSSQVSGFWPGIWTLGNLGRPGYGATTEGLWPYSYNSCDRGTLPNQTLPGETYVPSPYGSWGLSGLPGQRMSACTCPGGDHAGPSVDVGRSAPEIDVIEAQIGEKQNRPVGQVSQSAQVAPFDYNYQFDNKSTQIYNSSITDYNSYIGGVYQQAISGVTDVPSNVYNGEAFAVYGVEVFADKANKENGFVTWFADGKKSWTMYANAIGDDPDSGISRRLIPEEPMAMVINFGISEGFAKVEIDNLVYPAQMLVDYIRVYQREGIGKLGCDPSDYPTAKYIANHLEAYQNPNLTSWKQAGYTFPKNSLTGC